MHLSKRGTIITLQFSKGGLIFHALFSKEGLLFHCNSGDFILIVPLTTTTNNEKGLMLNNCLIENDIFSLRPMYILSME